MRSKKNIKFLVGGGVGEGLIRSYGISLLSALDRLEDVGFLSA